MSLEDRFSLAVNRRLGELGGTGTLLAAGGFDHRGELVRRWDLSVVQEGLDRQGRPVKYLPLEGSRLAVALAEAGWLATTLVVYLACDPAKGRASKSRRAWKATSPEAGATAAIFMAHGTSEVILVVRPDVVNFTSTVDRHSAITCPGPTMLTMKSRCSPRSLGAALRLQGRGVRAVLANTASSHARGSGSQAPRYHL